MKISHLTALHTGLAVTLLSSSLIVFANPNEQKIDYQQTTSKEETDAAKKAKPDVERRPAATTNQKKHSVQSVNAEAIKAQKKATHKAIKDAKAATPEVEGRPAVTTKKTLKPASAGGKHDLIESQKKETKQSIEDAAAASPEVEGRPAATTN